MDGTHAAKRAKTDSGEPVEGATRVAYSRGHRCASAVCGCLAEARAGSGAATDGRLESEPKEEGVRGVLVHGAAGEVPRPTLAREGCRVRRRVAGACAGGEGGCGAGVRVCVCEARAHLALRAARLVGEIA